MISTLVTAGLRLGAALAVLALAAPVQAQADGSLAVAFTSHVLQGPNLDHPTSLQFGPDGRLYVAEQDGTIHALTVALQGVDYVVTAAELLEQIHDLPNHDDDGTPNPGVTGRQVTGILVVGTPSAPVIYVGSSDPRIGAGSSGADTGLDTNSGVLSRLTLTPGGWEHLDLVRGLPRSEENHSINGIVLDAANNRLLTPIGGNTNMGAPSNNFAGLPEYALSTAILAIELGVIGESTYDLPTLDDEDRPGDPDVFDPFGGNDGKNQAVVVPGGPVWIYSPGWRNAYDLVLTQAGRLYCVDNGGNAGWGGAPSDCTNAVVEPGISQLDNLHHVPGPGFYAGHPNPTRADPANTFNAGNPQSPVSAANPVECSLLEPGAGDGALATWGTSTNGIAEYTSATFGGAMQGDLLLAGYGGKIRRVELDAAGTSAVQTSNLFTSLGGKPLDITTRGDGESFPGTIWVAKYSGGEVVVFRPDFVENCTAAHSLVLDEDGDGYSNADELDNGTNPCSAGDVPADFDFDLISDLNDPDDDDDGVPDPADPFALDASDGGTTALPLLLDWDNDGIPLGGLLDLGATGLIANGVTDYLAQFDPELMTAGGAAGAVTVDAVTGGTARGPANDQEFGFQAGFAAPDSLAPFIATARVLAPFAGLTPDPGQELGLALGTGTQSDFLRLVVTGDGVAASLELRDAETFLGAAPLSLPGPDHADLFLHVDPATAVASGSYRLTTAGTPGPFVPLFPPTPLPADWFGTDTSLALGLLATNGGAAPFPATWDHLRAAADGSLVTLHRVNAGGDIVPASDNGPPWVAHEEYAEGSTYTTAEPIQLHRSVPPGTPVEVFETELWDPPIGDEMTWELPVPHPGQYELRLYFAEIWHQGQAAGIRVFDVEVEGALVMDDYDIFADVGGYTGVRKTFQTTVSDGSLTLRLLHEVENPKVSAVEVLQAIGCEGTTPDCNGNGIADACDVLDGTLGTLTPYGTGLPGSGGIVPQLDVTGCFAAGSNSLEFEVTNGLGGASGLVLVGTETASLPLEGGTLLVAPPFVTLVTIALDGSGPGTGTLTIPVPPTGPAPAGTKITLQAAFFDAAAPYGISFSNGLLMTWPTQ